MTFHFLILYCDICQHRSKDIIRLYQQSRFLCISYQPLSLRQIFHLAHVDASNMQVASGKCPFPNDSSNCPRAFHLWKVKYWCAAPWENTLCIDNLLIHVAQKRKLFTFSFASISYQNILNHIRWQTNYATEQWQFNYAIIYLPFDVVKPGWLAEREGGRRAQARIFDNPLNRRRS